MQKKKRKRGKKYAMFVPLLLVLDTYPFYGGDFNGEPRVVQRRRLELLLPSMERSQTDCTNGRTLRSNKYTSNFLNPIKTLVFNKKFLIVWYKRIIVYSWIELEDTKNLQLRYLRIKNIGDITGNWHFKNRWMYECSLISIFIFQIRCREWYWKLIFLKSISYNYFE